MLPAMAAVKYRNFCTRPMVTHVSHTKKPHSPQRNLGPPPILWLLATDFTNGWSPYRHWKGTDSNCACFRPIWTPEIATKIAQRQEHCQVHILSVLCHKQCFWKIHYHHKLQPGMVMRCSCFKHPCSFAADCIVQRKLPQFAWDALAHASSSSSTSHSITNEGKRLQADVVEAWVHNTPAAEKAAKHLKTLYEDDENHIILAVASRIKKVISCDFYRLL